MNRIGLDPRLPDRVGLDFEYLKLLNVRLYELFRSIIYKINELVDEVSGAPYDLRVAQGLVSGVTAVNRFGRNPDVDVGTEDIGFVGGLFVPPTDARVHAIVSTSANDTAAGTGARTLTVNGLNGSYVDTTETVTLNGTTPVNTVNSYRIIHLVTVATAGTGLVNAGAISGTAATDATLSFKIMTGKGRSQLAFYMIPVGHTGYVTRYGGSINGSSTANAALELFVTPFGGALNLNGTLIFQGSGTTNMLREYETPLHFTEKSLIRLRVTVDVNNVDVCGFFDMYLVAN